MRDDLLALLAINYFIIYIPFVLIKDIIWSNEFSFLIVILKFMLIQITLAKALPEGLRIELPQTWFVLEPQTCYCLTLTWTPNQPIAIRETIRFTNENRGRYDVIVVLKSLLVCNLFMFILFFSSVLTTLINSKWRTLAEFHLLLFFI